MKILVVDDSSTMRRILVNCLAKMNMSNVAQAGDGNEALKVLAEQGPFDLCLTDWNMPNMTGLELLKTVRADEKFKHLPFLMVTAEAEKENIIEAVKSGVSNYVVKPFTGQTLKEKLEKVEQNLMAKKAS